MPTFSNRLPARQAHQGFDLRRTPTASPLSAVITCDDMVVCDTHYWQGRTIPCERICNEEGKTVDDSACPACQHKQGWRIHVYVSAIILKTSEHFLYETTANAAKAFEEYRYANKTLRGCAFNASRVKPSANAKIIILTNTINQARFPLPNPPDIPTALALIWRLPKDALAIAHTEPGAPQIRTANDLLDEMRNQPDDSGNPDDFFARREDLTRELAAAASGNGKTHKL